MSHELPNDLRLKDLITKKLYPFSRKITPRHFRRWGGKLPTQKKDLRTLGQENPKAP